MKTNAIILDEAQKDRSSPQFRVTKLTGADVIAKAQFVTVGVSTLTVDIPAAPTDLYPSGDVSVIIPITGIPAAAYQDIFYWKSDQKTTLWEIWISGDAAFEYKRVYKVQVVSQSSPVIVWQKPTNLSSIAQMFSCARKQFWKVKAQSSNSVWSETASFVNEFRLP